jgi:hypothetical protein
MRGHVELEALPALSPELTRKLNKRRRAPANSATHKESPGEKAAELTETSIRIDDPTPTSESDTPAVDIPSRPRASYYWTWKLLADGYSLADCEAIRGMDQTILISHLSRAVDEGLCVQTQWFLSDEQISVVELLVRKAPQERHRDMIGQLPAGVAYEHVALYARCSELSGPKRAPQA